MSKHKKQLKIESVLESFLITGYKGMTALDAINIYGDTCLHSSVSDLKNNRGIHFAKEPYTHICRVGSPVRFTRYFLEDECSIAKAIELLDLYRDKRGLEHYPKSKLYKAYQHLKVN